MYQLRPYQQDAVDATLNHFRQSDDSAVIVLPTGAGKSLVIAELASLAKRKILVLTHVKELVEQNHAKYQSYGLQAGIFSAGLKQKNLTHQVTFASIQSLARNIAQLNYQFSLVIIDECHRIGLKQDKDKGVNQYQQVIKHIQSLNPKLKILGLTATPYRLDTGWIYQHHYYGFVRREEQAQFVKCIFELPLRYMIKHQYLTPPKLINLATNNYDFSSLVPQANGEYQTQAVNELLAKYPRVTKAICEHIVELSQARQGVMIFAASVAHAQEIKGYIDSFSQQISQLVTGDTDNSQREKIIQAFKAKQIKYLINVSVLTTGFDAPHVDVIAILRPTQSISLYQQIVGRGLRLADGKQDCLVLDYAGNEFDLFQPEVGSPKPNSASVPVMVPCPVCNFANTFWGKVDSDGDLVEHYGRRCQGLVDIAANKSDNPPKLKPDNKQQCQFRFVFKQCPDCMAENDIAARTCHHCQKVLVDPDELIKKALKLKDLTVIRCSGMTLEAEQSKLKIRYFDEDGLEINETFNFDYPKAKQEFNRLFGRRFKQTTQPTLFDKVQEIVKQAAHFTHPDFVIAKREKHYWQIKQRVFDYQGNFRKANQM
ncbi:ATP-dependent helicase [Saccharobesus litoralis]|uniref:ATP-dependent helicase n=1 Tax=Saccharobesus litoralis TaxID=2172099 RepID=A0A2S0VMD3_9ALTE|nr:DEAD/DEAH box helicase [Saccharobesus litoralis]AWB65356.1 ATP-dependent helicase [Saccharobesus litoralis]